MDGAPDVAEPLTLVVAIVTFRREASLRELLAEIARQARPQDVAVEVLVVDNDPAGSAASVAAEAGVTYHPEATPGLAAVRNAALDRARHARLVLFIDDDERPEPGWLLAMVATWRRYTCAAVVGPVPRRLPEGTDPWVLASGFFARAPRPEGALLSGANTGNLLLDRAAVEAWGVRFDARFGLSGGEDTMFSRELLRHGAELRWCAGGAAVEIVPAERATRSWVLARERRTGNSWSRVHLALARSAGQRWLARGWLAGHAAALALRAGGMAGASAVRRSLELRARARCTLARARGVISGALGATVLEYRREPDVRPASG